MKSAVILAAGQFPRKEYPLYLLHNADVLICCDRALQEAEKRGLHPDIAIGDMDSVCGRALKRLENGETGRNGHKGKVIRDSDQQTNDLTKAFNYVMENIPDVSEITILGAGGKSEAHTIANLSLLMEYEKRCREDSRGINIQMVSDYSTAISPTPDEKGIVELHIGKGRRISIFSPDSTLRIKSEGLRWPTDEVVFDNWWKASLNVADDDLVRLKLNHKSPLLVVLD